MKNTTESTITHAPSAPASASKPHSAAKWLLASALAAAIAAFIYFDGAQYLTLDALKAQRASLSDWVGGNFLLAWLSFIAVYIAVTAISLPGALVLTLAGGALFGLLWGTIAVSFASTIGATCAFLASRFMFRDAIQAKFSERLSAIENGVKRDGGFYLLSLRLVPLVPFFVVNLVMGLTPLRAGTFYVISQLGMLPGTLAYVFAGTQLAQITSLKGILSPGLVAAFFVIGALPVVLKLLLNRFSSARAAQS